MALHVQLLSPDKACMMPHCPLMCRPRHDYAATLLISTPQLAGQTSCMSEDQQCNAALAWSGMINAQSRCDSEAEHTATC